MRHFIHASEGRKPVESLKTFEFNGERFFLHVRTDNKDAIGITHHETGFSAGHVPRYTSYHAVGMKRIERGIDAWLADALMLLKRVNPERFELAMKKAKETAHEQG